MDILDYNRRAWDAESARGNKWTVPVDAETIANARAGDWSVVLTPTEPVPRDWFGESLVDVPILCLASGGGQQAPIFAAAGARVTLLDNSPKQLAADEAVAEREGLEIALEQGDMADLSRFDDESFDLVFHPCSNAFVPDVLPVWREVFRVLKPGGALLAGFSNPVRYIFDYEKELQGQLEVRHTIPYADIRDLTPAELKRFRDDLEPMEFGHTLEDQIGGQLAAGLVLVGFYEDRYPDDADDPLSRHLATFMATRAMRPHAR